MKIPALILGAALAAGLSANVEAQVVVVVNPKNPINTLTPKHVSQLYTGSASTFPGGGGAELTDLPEASKLREEFLAKIVGRSDSQVRAAWVRLIFSGKALPPRILATPAEVRKFVAGNERAIGFIDRGSVDASVKVVLAP
jgi:ABC-type phosphate transport system substrate-binding protein